MWAPSNQSEAVTIHTLCALCVAIAEALTLYSLVGFPEDSISPLSKSPKCA